jgi:hypothetical protein
MKNSSSILNRIILLILILLVYVNICVSQGNSSNINSDASRKNVIYATLGLEPGEFYGTIMVNYERKIVQFQKSFISSIWTRVGAGPWVWWTDKGTNYIGSISMLTGRKTMHFESGAGLLITYNSESKSFRPLIHNRYFAGNLGLRLQKYGRPFVFRTGIGWPEFLYISSGISF